MTRSTTNEFGRKLEATPGTVEPLVAADYAHKNYDPSIVLDPTINESSPAGNHTRLLETYHGVVPAKVAFGEDIVPGSAVGVAPPWYDILKASGFTVAGAVATLGAVPANSSSLSCVHHDGIKTTRAWGVRGLSEIFAENVADRVRINFSGSGHGDEVDHDEWPTNVVDTTVAAARFLDCGLTIGGASGFTPELRSFHFAMTGDPTLIDSALAADGIAEHYLAQTQAGIKFGVWQHTKAQRDWLAYALASTHLALDLRVPLSAALELKLTGSIVVAKNPQRTAQGNVGTYPLEFKFDRLADIVITQQARA